MSFSISVIKEPIYLWNERRQCNVINWDESAGSHHLNFDFDYQDFDELQNFLDLKLPPAKQSESESYAKYSERLKNEHLAGAKDKGYEMLGRFWYEFEDVVYYPAEINKLQKECLKAKGESQNPQLITAVNKISEACDDALKNDSGLYFGSD
jgi:hypothetical protein